MIETYSHPDNVRLHAAACQIKVFKLKGADRKHKQDREKIMKKPPAEQAKLQPSYECTVLSDVSFDFFYTKRIFLIWDVLLDLIRVFGYHTSSNPHSKSSSIAVTIIFH